MKPMHKNKAFTMIEMSVVLIIVGLLAAGIIGGTSLIKASRLATARALTSSSPVPKIEGLVAWYETSSVDSLKASEAYKNGQISTWYDISPSSIVLKKNTLSRTASSALTYKSDGINGLPSLNFSSSGNLTLSEFYQGSCARSTIFVVFQPLSTPNATTQNLIDSTSSGSSALFGIESNLVRFNAGTSVGTATGSNPANMLINTNYILAAYLNGASSKAYLNNTKTMAGNAVVDAGSNPLSGLTIATTKSGGSAFTGLISEVIIYNRPLQATERDEVFRYLSTKYKIPVLGF